MLKQIWTTVTTLKFLCLFYLCDASTDKTQDYYKEWCSSVPNIDHAVVQRIRFAARVVCENGYKLVGEEKLTCNNSEWNPVKLPYCERVDNPPIADAGEDIVVYLPQTYAVLNGSLSTDDIGIVSYQWSSVSEEYIHMFGANTPYLHLYDLVEGTYLFRLKVLDTSGQQSSDDVTVSVKPASEECSSLSKLHYKFSWISHGSTGLLRCDKGYYFDTNVPLNELKVICIMGKWKLSEGVNVDSLPNCIIDVDSCGVPPSIPHTILEFSGTGQAIYTCETDYTGPVTVFHCDGGDWKSDTTPTCQRDMHFMSCQPPPSIKNGQYKEIPVDTSQYLPGSKVKYDCEPSYILMGNPILECLTDYTWSRHEPVCKPSSSVIGAYCEPIPPVPNGNCQCNPSRDLNFCEPFFPTMEVVCTCNSGYKLVGNVVLTCTDKGQWNSDVPTCVKGDDLSINTEGQDLGPTRMNTLAVVIATACSVLGILLLIMAVMIIRRRKHRPRHFHQVGVPPPYTRVHSSSFDDLDRVALIGYDAARLPTYEEALRNSTSTSIQRGQGLSEVQVSNDFRPLPNIQNVMRNNNVPSGDIQSIHSNRHSITTMSTVNRDGISEVFGSIDTVNYSLSDASTSVTVDTLDSAASRPSHGSGTATAGSVNTSQENLVTEEAPLLENDGNKSEDEDEEMDTKEEDKS